MRYTYYISIITLAFAIYGKPHKITIIPFVGFEHEDILFNPQERDDTTRPFRLLKNALEALDNTVQVATQTGFDSTSDCVIAFGSHSPQIRTQLTSYTGKKVLFLFEPPTVSPIDYEAHTHELFNTVYSMADALVGVRYKKFYYPQPSLTIDVDTNWNNRKKFCTLIASNKSASSPYELYSKRLETITFFEKNAPKDFEFYGVEWTAENHPCYQGTVATKKSCLEHYKFCICYENTRGMAGYVTEKIFDCLVAGCIPVYLGADNITTYIPGTCFIDARQFKTDEQLYTYLQTFDEHDYQKTIYAIKKFLSSTQAFLFSCEFFVHTILKEIDQGYCMNTVFSPDICQKLMQADFLHTVLESQRYTTYKT